MKTIFVSHIMPAKEISEYISNINIKNGTDKVICINCEWKGNVSPIIERCPICREDCLAWDE